MLWLMSYLHVWWTIAIPIPTCIHIVPLHWSDWSRRFHYPLFNNSINEFKFMLLPTSRTNWPTHKTIEDLLYAMLMWHWQPNNPNKVARHAMMTPLGWFCQILSDTIWFSVTKRMRRRHYTYCSHVLLHLNRLHKSFYPIKRGVNEMFPCMKEEQANNQ